MKKYILGIVTGLAGIAMVFALALSVSAEKPEKGEKGLKGQAGQSNTAFVELWEKDAGFEIVEGGAWGKLKYNLEGEEFEFLFNGHGLTPGTDYTLIYYPEPQTDWPWPVVVIDSGIANTGGDLHLSGSFDFEGNLEGAKIWLVKSEDMVSGELSSWNPSEYLFEYDLINYTDTTE